MKWDMWRLQKISTTEWDGSKSPSNVPTILDQSLPHFLHLDTWDMKHDGWCFWNNVTNRIWDTVENMEAEGTLPYITG